MRLFSKNIVKHSYYVDPLRIAARGFILYPHVTDRTFRPFYALQLGDRKQLAVPRHQS